MIKISDIQHASANVRARAKRTWIKSIGPSQFRVTPKFRSKSKRIVMFLPAGQVLCLDARTGEQCAANSWGVPCYHVVRAATHLMKLHKQRAA